MKTKLKSIYLAIRKLLFLLVPALKHIPVDAGKLSNILVFRLDRIGDLVLTTAMFRALKAAYPDARITVMVKKYAADIVHANPYIDNVVIYPGFVKSVMSMRNKFDLIVDPLTGYEAKNALLTYLLSPRYSVGFDIESRGRFFTFPIERPPEKQHFVESLFKLLRPLNIKMDKKLDKPEIFTTDTACASFDKWRVETNFKPENFLISIHPGGFYPTQRWPSKYFAALIEKLRAGYPQSKIILFGAGQEKTFISETYDSIKHIANDNVFVFLDQKLLNVICYIRNSKLFIGNNSGLVHVAAAVNTPTLSTMGPTIPWVWRPYGDPQRNIVLRKDIPCSPCNLGVCPGHECMRDISVEEMYENAKSILNRIYGIKNI
jgi:ADP-heptose:LPS heptosyltransferase